MKPAGLLFEYRTKIGMAGLVIAAVFATLLWMTPLSSYIGSGASYLIVGVPLLLGMFVELFVTMKPKLDLLLGRTEK